VGGCAPRRSRFHGRGQPAVVSRGQGKHRPWHAEGISQLTSLHRVLVLRSLTNLTRVNIIWANNDAQREARRSESRPPGMLACVVHR